MGKRTVPPPPPPTTAPPAGEEPRYCRPVLAVEILEAKPNPLFSEAQTAMIRFLRYYGAKVACAHCGHRKMILWTMRCSFRIAEPAMFVLKKGETVYPPLTPVCQKHIMAPEMVEVTEKGEPADA